MFVWQNPAAQRPAEPGNAIEIAMCPSRFTSLVLCQLEVASCLADLCLWPRQSST